MAVRIEDAPKIHGQVFVGSVAYGANRDAGNMLLCCGGEDVSCFHLDDTSLLAERFLLFGGCNNFRGSQKDIRWLCARCTGKFNENWVAGGLAGMIQSFRALRHNYVTGLQRGVEGTRESRRDTNIV